MTQLDSMLELLEEVRDEVEVEILTEMSVLFEKEGFTKVIIDPIGDSFFIGNQFDYAFDSLRWDELETLHGKHCNRNYEDFYATWTAEKGWDN